MSTLKPQLSLKNEHRITKERYYELKHFCLQYDEYRKALNNLKFYKSYNSDVFGNSHKKYYDSPVEFAAMLRIRFQRRIDIIEQALKETTEKYFDQLFLGVTKGMSYDELYMSHDLNCSRSEYYKLYRKFFYILDSIRD